MKDLEDGMNMIKIKSASTIMNKNASMKTDLG